MKRLIGISGLCLCVAACAPQIPDSAAGVVDSGKGVGFGSYDAYEAQREAQLIGQAPASASAIVPPPAAVQSGTLDASAANPAPPIVGNSSGISDENNFNVVSSQRDIAADASLIERNRAQYQVIQPTSLPTRPGSNAPNIVEYALRTTNPVGTALYKRSSFNAVKKFQRACAGFASADLAQEAFLSAGGPEKDRQGMDPDGDGFACGWNPAPFRAVRGG